jgi:uncharacterized SAM-binding protein YcdF (DUF218 family)
MANDAVGLPWAKSVTRRRLAVGLAALVLVSIVAVGIFRSLGRWVSTGASVPDRANVLVALGGDAGFRVRTVARLMHDGYAPIVLVTGLEGAPQDTRRHYLEWRSRVLIEMGVPADRIVFEDTATNSYQEATATLALMRKLGWKTALVVSDPPHLRRLDWIWGRVFAGSGLSYRLVASEPAWWDADHWWRNEHSGQFVLTEVIKLGFYFVKYR